MSTTNSMFLKFRVIFKCYQINLNNLGDPLECVCYSGCQATCMRGYTFPSGETQIFFVCDNGQWKVKGSADDTIPQCKRKSNTPGITQQ